MVDSNCESWIDKLATLSYRKFGKRALLEIKKFSFRRTFLLTRSLFSASRMNEVKYFQVGNAGLLSNNKFGNTVEIETRLKA